MADNHTTHFDDCGCKSAKLASAEEEIERLRDYALRVEKMLAEATSMRFTGGRQILGNSNPDANDWLDASTYVVHPDALSAFEATQEKSDVD